jgi:hypothetical protein
MRGERKSPNAKTVPIANLPHQPLAGNRRNPHDSQQLEPQKIPQTALDNSAIMSEFQNSWKSLQTDARSAPRKQREPENRQ